MQGDKAGWARKRYRTVTLVDLSLESVATLACGRRPGVLIQAPRTMAESICRVDVKVRPSRFVSHGRKNFGMRRPPLPFPWHRLVPNFREGRSAGLASRPAARGEEGR